MGQNELISQSKLKEFGKDYVKILWRELKREGKDASGALLNSLDYRLVEDAKQIKIEILANDYLKYVDEGRKAGKYPPIKAIAEWVNVKGISEDAIWPIAKSIYKFGIKPTHIIQKVVKEFETSPTLKNKYEDEIVSNIIKSINDKYKTIG